jgi:type VI secretion system protein ImpH
VASAPRSTTDQLNPLQRLAAEPHRFSLFAALRLLEQAHADRPRLGESRRAATEAVRLGQSPHLTFAPAEVSSCESPEGERVRLEQYVFGVFGPNGALPLHLTEHAYERRRHKEDATFADFVNLFQHRLISLFYRAWANSDPATSFDRPESDRFADWVGATFGLAGESARNRDVALDYAKLSRAGLYAQQTRSADGLQAILAGYFGLEVQIRQFVGAWLSTPKEAFCRLGAGGEPARLGLSATIGENSWQCQHKFEIVLGPLALDAFRDFLPGARGLAELHALVRLYTNDEWTWQLRLLLRDVEIPGVAIGRGGQLGWTSWLGARRADAGDVLIEERRAAAANKSESRDHG